MCVGVWKHFLIARIGRQDYDGWVMIEPDGLGDHADVSEWVDRAVEFVRRLPKK
jgi:sugar phosphate isomerase/epimerase